ncbi:Mitogen-activated protein kinase kinase kinase mom-4 [Ilyonectria robusta]
MPFNPTNQPLGVKQGINSVDPKKGALIRRVSSKAVVYLHHVQTCKRQQSEQRANLAVIEPTPNERRAISVNRHYRGPRARSTSQPDADPRIGPSGLLGYPQDKTTPYITPLPPLLLKPVEDINIGHLEVIMSKVVSKDDEVTIANECAIQNNASTTDTDSLTNSHVIVDDHDEYVKGLLINYVDQDALINIIYNSYKDTIQKDEPEVQRKLLILGPEVNIPDWYRQMAEICLSDDPRLQLQASSLLKMFPSLSTGDDRGKLNPPVDDYTLQQYLVHDYHPDNHPHITTDELQSEWPPDGRPPGETPISNKTVLIESDLPVVSGTTIDKKVENLPMESEIRNSWKRQEGINSNSHPTSVEKAIVLGSSTEFQGLCSKYENVSNDAPSVTSSNSFAGSSFIGMSKIEIGNNEVLDGHRSLKEAAESLYPDKETPEGPQTPILLLHRREATIIFTQYANGSLKSGSITVRGSSINSVSIGFTAMPLEVSSSSQSKDSPKSAHLTAPSIDEGNPDPFIPTEISKFILLYINTGI